MVKRENIVKILKELAKNPEPYLSEAQFQFELAWYLQKEFSDAKILLEYTACSTKVEGKKKRFESDILVVFGAEYQSIELKYKTAKATVGEVELTQQSGQPGTKYDYLWDIHRIEILKEKNKNEYDFHGIGENHKCLGGFAIFLTNDGSYWNSGRDGDSAKNFNLCEKKNKGQMLEWNGEHKDWMNSRQPFALSNNYSFKWETYKELTNGKEFKYLITEVK